MSSVYLFRAASLSLFFNYIKMHLSIEHAHIFACEDKYVSPLINRPDCLFFWLCGFWIWTVRIWTDPEHRESIETVLCLLGWK